jgi:hypothetical protein
VIINNGKGNYNASAWLVVCPRKDSLDAWEVLKANKQTCHTVSDALEDLLESLSDSSRDSKCKEMGEVIRTAC